MEFSTEQAVILNDILRWRRDVRHFRTDPVAESVIDRLRAVMELAPSVGNSRPWRVLRVKDQGLRAAVQDIFERCNHEAAAGYDDATIAEYVRLKLAGLREAPVHLAVFTETAPAEGRGLGRRTMPETLQFSVHRTAGFSPAIFAWATPRSPMIARFCTVPVGSATPRRNGRNAEPPVCRSGRNAGRKSSQQVQWLL